MMEKSTPPHLWHIYHQNSRLMFLTSSMYILHTYIYIYISFRGKPHKPHNHPSQPDLGELIIPAIPYLPIPHLLWSWISERCFSKSWAFRCRNLCRNHTKVPKLLGDGLVWSDCPIQTCQKMEMAMKKLWWICDYVNVFVYVYMSGCQWLHSYHLFRLS